MLSRVIIKNFKSIGEKGVDLELKPLTILVGPNGGGKSSILEASLLAWHGGGATVVLPWLNEEVEVDWLLHKRNKDAAFHVGLAFSEPGLLGFKPCFTHSHSHDGGSNLWGVLYSPHGSVEQPRQHFPENKWQDFEAESRKRYDTSKDKVRLVSASRGGLRIKEPGITGQLSPGIHGEHLLAYLARILTSNDYAGVAAVITKWAEKFGVSKLKAGPRDADRVGADYIDSELDVGLQMALASTGARQILTVVAHLFGSEPGSLIMIEEPEISLHPEKQVTLIELFAEALKEKKQIIVTTHSSLLVLALSRSIRRDDLKATDIAIYDVIKGSDGTSATALEFTDAGYVKGWIPSFKKTEQELMTEWAQSLADV